MPYADLNGVRIYYEVHGEGEPVIFLNGILATTASWAFQLPVFSKEFKVILMDFRGQGNSDKPRTRYTMDMHVEDVRALLDHLGVDKVHVVGISYGAEVGMMFALKYPERVRSLVVACAVSHVDRPMRLRADRWMMAARLRSGRYLFITMVPDIYSDEFIGERWDFISSTAPRFEEVDFDAFIELLKSFMELDITDRLGEIKAPTLVVAAEEDRTKPPRYSRLIHERIPNSELVIIKGAGHVVIWEKPDEFNEVVLRFLRKHSGDP